MIVGEALVTKDVLGTRAEAAEEAGDEGPVTHSEDMSPSMSGTLADNGCMGVGETGVRGHSSKRVTGHLSSSKPQVDG
jgi:hypothetical protein